MRACTAMLLLIMLCLGCNPAEEARRRAAENNLKILRIELGLAETGGDQIDRLFGETGLDIAGGKIPEVFKGIGRGRAQTGAGIGHP